MGHEYDMAQAIEDGYLAACEILQRDIFFDDRPENERQSVLLQEDFEGKTVTDSRTGQTVPIDEQERYGATDFEKRLLLPDRVRAMCSDLFDGFAASAGGPEQKTIVFCARDQHADAVAAALNNLYAEWSAAAGHSRAEPYAFECTATGGGTDFIPDLRGASRHHFIATTVDLLTTGVDVPVAWRAASAAGSTLKALTGQFARGGTEELENPQVFQTPEVVRAGGLEALKALGKPAEILLETKERLFAA